MNRTQRRHLRLAARVVGIGRDLSDRVRASIAIILQVPTLCLRDWARKTGRQATSAAIRAVLGRVRDGARRATDLLVCGQLVGSWGEPLHWDARRRRLLRSPLSTEQTAAS